MDLNSIPSESKEIEVIFFSYKYFYFSSPIINIFKIKVIMIAKIKKYKLKFKAISNILNIFFS
jgi:hypothetical protein